MSHQLPPSPFEPHSEAPITPAFGSPLPRFAPGQAPPRYGPTVQYPLVYSPLSARRRSRRGLFAGLVIGLVVLLLACLGGVIGGFTMMSGGLGRAADPTAPPAATESAQPTSQSTVQPTAQPVAPPADQSPAPTDGHVVVYEVTGEGPVGITYLTDARGTADQVRDADLPWRVEVRMAGESFVVSVIALRIGAGPGALTCRALVDGKQVAGRPGGGHNFASVTCAHLFSG